MELREVAFQEVWPLVRSRKQYIYVKIYIVKWPFQKESLIRVASPKGFHGTTVCIIDFFYHGIFLSYIEKVILDTSVGINLTLEYPLENYIHEGMSIILEITNTSKIQT